MASIFAQPKPATSGFFGSAAATSAPQKSVFGAPATTATTTQPATGGLFGSQPAPATGLFGASTTQAQPANNSLFGASTAQAQPSSNSLFGAQPQPQSSSLFGQPQQTQSTGLFGSKPAQPQNNAFGAQPQPQNSVFGSQPQQNPTQQNQSIFGQSQQQNSFAGSLGHGVSADGNIGALSAQAQRELVQSRLQSAGLNSSVREKSVEQQVMTLVDKWKPDSSNTLLQTYLYNAANPAFAPFYHPSPGESEREYEAALAKKPEPVDGNTWVPVLIRGFKALGERVEYQARFVQNMQVRLHEMNNALTAIMQKHSQDLSVRIDTAKRQHAAVSARTLRLAVKCQVLRNRGYALDNQEEGLRTTLLELEQKVQHPSFASREEEIWARMVTLRERARWLEEEGKRLGGSVAEAEKIPADVIDSARRILRDYDAQIQQLSKEVNEVHKDFSEWTETRL